jgi:hypothetical protein
MDRRRGGCRRRGVWRRGWHGRGWLVGVWKGRRRRWCVRGMGMGMGGRDRGRDRGRGRLGMGVMGGGRGGGDGGIGGGEVGVGGRGDRSGRIGLGRREDDEVQGVIARDDVGRMGSLRGAVNGGHAVRQRISSFASRGSSRAGSGRRYCDVSSRGCFSP